MAILGNMFPGEKESFEDTEFKRRLKKYLPEVLRELVRDDAISRGDIVVTRNGKPPKHKR